MKRIVLLLVVSTVLLLTSCSINRGINQTKDHFSDTNGTAELGEVPSENENTVETAEHSSMEGSDNGPKKENIDGEQFPGPDVAELVNPRGDEVTVYKLADGTYMDRIERRFTYNGTDTWTDEDGVEWNEKVH